LDQSTSQLINLPLYWAVHSGTQAATSPVSEANARSTTGRRCEVLRNKCVYCQANLFKKISHRRQENKRYTGEIHWQLLIMAIANKNLHESSRQQSHFLRTTQ
jgi:hypothetical protein